MVSVYLLILLFFSNSFSLGFLASLINKSLITHYTKGTLSHNCLSIKKFRVYFILYISSTFHHSFTYLFTIDHLRILSVEVVLLCVQHILNMFTRKLLLLFYKIFNHIPPNGLLPYVAMFFRNGTKVIGIMILCD